MVQLGANILKGSLEMPKIGALAIILALAMAVAALTLAVPAVAGDNAEGFGLGLMLGEPSGLSAKMWTGTRNALDGGLAWSTSKNSGAAAHVDYLWHVHDMAKTGKGILPFYYGVGIRYRDHDDSDPDFGVRFPLGLDYLFARSAFDVFFELVPVLDLAPEQEFSVNLAVGGRYFF
jgi:hypothetical protein